MANPWEMNWQAEEEKKPEAPKNPWEMNWQTEETPTEEAPQDREMGMLLPFSWDRNGNDWGFDSNAGILGTVKRSVMLPGEVMAGKVDPGSEEGLNRALEFAGTFAGGQTAFPKARPPAVLQGRDGINPLRNAIIGPADDAAVIAQRTQDLRDIGAEPTVGMVAGSERAALKEQALRPTAVGQKQIQTRIEDAFAKQGDEFDRVIGGLASRNAPGAKTNTPQELGDMLRAQAQAAKDAAFARSDDLYGNVDALTANVSASGSATRDYAKSLLETKKNLTASEKLNRGPYVDSALKQAQAIVTDLDKGAMNFNRLKQARTTIGSLANDPNLDPAAKGYLEGLRKSLTTDMEDTASAAGPDALQAFRKANNQFRRNVDKETGFGKGSTATTLLSKTAPEDIYKYATGKLKEGGTRLNFIRRQVERSEDGKAAWDNVAASVVERMGKTSGPDGEIYNPTAFMREWKNMAPEAKDVLFNGTGRAQYRADLDRLARIAENMSKYNRKANHSNTANHATVMNELNPLDRSSLLGAVLGGVKGFAIVATGKALNAGGKNYQARMLANPQTVNWLAGIPKAEMQKGGLRAHVATLNRMLPGLDDATQIAVRQYLLDIDNTDNNQN